MAKKNIMTIQAVNFMAYYNREETKTRFSSLPLKIQWTLRKNAKELDKCAKDFEEFRNDLITKRNEDWFVEGNGKCEKYTQKNENGEDVEMLRITEEYMDEYKKYEDNLNSQLEDILREMNEITYTPIDLDDFVEKAEGTDITMDDVDMISMFEEETKKEDE